MHVSVKFTSARFDEYETNHKKKRRTSLEEKVLGLTEKGTIFKKKLYSHTVLKENQNEDANEVPYLPKKEGLNFCYPWKISSLRTDKNLVFFRNFI